MDKKNIGDFLNKVKSWADQEDNIKALILVGSYARGEARADSDIDLVVIATRPEIYINDRTFVDIFYEKTDVKIDFFNGTDNADYVQYKMGGNSDFKPC